MTQPSFKVEQRTLIRLWEPEPEPEGDTAAFIAAVGTSRKAAAAMGYPPRAAPEPQQQPARSAAGTGPRRSADGCGKLTNKINEILRGK